MDLKYNFLDGNAYLGINEIRKEKKKYFDLIFGIVDLMTELMDYDEYKKYSSDRDKYIIATLYDCYVTFSSEILLLERGLVTDFEILLRSFYEKKFKLFAVIKDKRNYKRVLLEGIYFRDRLKESIKNNEHGAFDDLVDVIKDEKNDIEGREMSIESWANNSGLIKEYDKEYALLSGRTHFDIGSLANKVLENENEATFYTFSYNEFDDYSLIASEQFYICILKVLEYKKINDFNIKIEKLNSMFDELYKEGKKDESGM